MAILTTDIVYRLSGGAANSSAIASLGGAKSSSVMPSGIFDDVTSGEASAGATEYRCIYVHNGHATLPLVAAVVWISTNTTGNRLAIGLGSSAINATEQTVASETTAPTAVAFTQPASKGAGLSIGDIPAGQHKAIWFRRTVAAATGANNDTFTVRVEGDTAA
jgi:hypothetical protein